MIEFVQGNVLAGHAEGLLLAIDGAKKGMEGNVARAYARRWPDAWMEIEDAIRYPLPLGRSIAIRPENETGFSLLLIASTLHHLAVLTEPQKASIVRSALDEALKLAIRHRIRSVATVPMTGGWRLELAPALSAMMGVLKPYDSPNHLLTVNLHMLNTNDIQLAVNLAKANGVNARTCTTDASDG